MAKIVSIKGVREVLAEIKRQEKRMAAGAERGLKIAGLKLQRESQRMVPVDFGILKNSAFTRATGKGLKTQVNIGYTAHYALYVHENVEMKGKGMPRRKPSKGRYWDPQGRGSAKFLEEPFRRLTPDIIQIVRKHAGVSGK